MAPTRFVRQPPVVAEPYEDRMARICKLLRGQPEAIAFVHEQARMIVRLEGERDDLLDAA